MRFVLTLIASSTPLNPAHLGVVMDYCAEHGLPVTAGPRWLAQHKAADILLQQRPNADHMRGLRALLAHDRIDILVVDAENRLKKILMADMDETVIQGETLDRLGAIIGKEPEIAVITHAAMTGEMDFRTALARRIEILAGMTTDQIQILLDATILSPGAEWLVAGMKQMGAKTILVSSGFTFFTEEIARRAGFNHHHGNVFDIKDGVLTGKLREPVLDKTVKLDFLHYYVTDTGLTPADVVAIGDGSNDIPMLQAAGLGIGYHPKPPVAEAIDNLILYGDLTAALYAQGLIPKT